MRESTIQKDVRLRFSELRAGILLRYQVGLFYSPDGTPVKVGEPGVSDLIGIVPHVVTQEDVGRTIGVFVAAETKQVKDTTSKARKESQGNFMSLIKRFGGISGIVRSVSDIEDMVEKKWDSGPMKKVQ